MSKYQSPGAKTLRFSQPPPRSALKPGLEAGMGTNSLLVMLPVNGASGSGLGKPGPSGNSHTQGREVASLASPLFWS